MNSHVNAVDSYKSDRKHLILKLMYGGHSTISFRPEDGAFNSFNYIVNNEELFGPELHETLSGQDLLKFKFEIVMSTLKELCKLGFVETRIEASTAIKSSQTSFVLSRKYTTDELSKECKFLNWTSFNTWLFEASQPGHFRGFEVPRVPTESDKSEYWNIRGIEYTLTSKGYEVSMAIVAHSDAREVQKASIAASQAAIASSEAAQKSAKIATYALIAAYAIAFGSIGNLVINLPGGRFVLPIYILGCGYAAWRLRARYTGNDKTN